MLVVDPMKRLSVQELLNSRWTNVDLPPYLDRMKSQLNPGRQPHSLTSLLDASGTENGPDWIEDIGYLDMSVLEELARNLGLGEAVVRNALEMDGENAVKVAYKLIQDRNLGFNRTSPRKSNDFIRALGLISYLSFTCQWMLLARNPLLHPRTLHLRSLCGSLHRFVPPHIIYIVSPAQLTFYRFPSLGPQTDYFRRAAPS